MSWSIAFDDHWQRDVGYGVPAFCDHPDCSAEIDRGLPYVCGGDAFGGADGCGLFFCGEHGGGGLCSQCSHNRAPFKPKSDHPEWIKHKATDPSWAEWRQENGIPEISALESGISTG